MKKKLISLLILITMILPMFLNFYQVKAYSGEVDPENYITLPSRIWLEEGVGTGTIRLSSNASDYDISYQKVDLTETQYNNFDTKNSDINDWIEECNTTIQQKRANIETLQTEMNNLRDSETATEEEITAAENAYNTAVQDLQTYATTAETTLATLKTELYALVPDYTSSWTETTNTEDNIQLDFSDYSGTVYFVLWVKITDGTNTYYDMQIYAPTIENEENVTISETTANINVDETLQLTATSSTNSTITWESSDEDVATVSEEGLVTGIAEGTAVITATGSENSAICTVTVRQIEEEDEEWTDFSNAEFELKKDGTTGAILEISNVTPKEGSDYYLLITSDENEPTADEFESKYFLTYDEEKQIFIVRNMANYIELNQDLYAAILESQGYDDEKVILYGEEIERFAEPKYSDAFFATFMSYDNTQLITTFTHDEVNDRNIQIKVGKITDTAILQKIKNQDTSGFADLLAFAKSNNGIYNKEHAADKNYYAIAYNAGEFEETGNSVIDLEGLQDEEYYFLYIEVYDEEGKYIGQEAVTLAQASVYEDGEWYLFFYGGEDFEWADFEDVEDDTKAPVTLPNTGIGKYIAIISVLAIVVIASYIQIKKMKEIR